MYTVKTCLCCNSERLRRHPAVVSPFIAHYAVGQRPFPCNLLECTNCGFRFFDSRLAPEETGRLYEKYRGPEYFAARHKYEPWYSRKINDGIGSDQSETQRRNAAMLTFVKSRFEPASFRTVLDFGGDRGQFIPAELGAEKFVFELSNANPVPGVLRLEAEEAKTRRFDFLMCSGVLEHCSDPGEFLEQLVRLGTPECVFYFSVPYERYDIGSVKNTAACRARLNFLLRFEKLLMLVDLYSTVGRFRWNRIPPLGLLKCHEHLNFFDERSMTHLLERAGLELLASNVVNVAQYPARNESMYVLARRTTGSSLAHVKAEQETVS